MTETTKPLALKLAKLPDRKPVKVMITLPAELAAKLNAYAAAYREAYGHDEDVTTLVPFMLATFIDTDRNFMKALVLGRARGSTDRARNGDDISSSHRGRVAPA